jgi:hypothetical protein
VKVEGLGFQRAAALNTPEVLGDFFHQCEFSGVGRIIRFDEVGAQSLVSFGILGRDDDLLSG